MPDWILPRPAATTIGVVLYDRFSNLCLANTIEPLRAANDLLDWQAYDWHTLTPNGAPVLSSSGLSVTPSGALADAQGGDILLVMPSYGHLAYAAATAALRRGAARYRILGGLDSGSWLLAAAGLLEGRAATIHFELFDAFAERFPNVLAQRARWVEDGDRLSSAGAAATFELMLHVIANAHGTALTTEIAALFLQGDPPPPGARAGRIVARALAAMEAHVETPLSIAQIAERAGCRQRELETQFTKALGTSPRTAYRRLRLGAARRLLRDGSLPVAEVAVRCGYGDASAFARAIRREFGVTPRALR